MSRLKAIVFGVCGGIGLAGGLTYTMNVGAVTCCDPWGIPGSIAFVSAGNAVTSALTTAVETTTQYVEQYLLNTVENGLGTIYSEKSKQVAAGKVIREGYIEAQTQLYLERKRSEAMATLPKEGEFDSALVSGMLLSEQSGAEMVQRQQLGREFIDRTLYSPYQSPELERLRQKGRWCTPLGATLGLCADPVSSESGYADVGVDAVLGSGKEVTYSDERREAAIDYVDTVVASGLQSQSTTSTAQAQQADALTIADQAAMSIVANSFLEMAAERSRRNQTTTAEPAQ